MLFKNLEITDREKVYPYLLKKNSFNSDYCFGNLFIWKDKVKTAFSVEENSLFIRFNKNNLNQYLFPCSENPKKALELLMENEKSLIIIDISEDDKEFIEHEFKDKFIIEETRDYFDYLYLKNDLVELVGSKYHSKRNFINRFKMLYPDYRLEPITDKNINLCYDMADDWLFTFKKDEITEDMLFEKKAIEYALNYFNELKFYGCLLKVKNEIIAFTVGERLNNLTHIIHVEKANTSFTGSYPVINQTCAQNLNDEIVFINREDDMGLLGLRKSKESYYPIKMVKKYTARIK